MSKGPFLIFLFILLIAGGAFIFYSRSSLSPYIKSSIPTNGNQSATTDKWELIKKAIAECRVTQVYQTHSLKVSARLKDGTEIKGTEPSIDAVIIAAEAAADKCGEISIATE